ncbi:hypothetical protein GCM10010116_33210 [Microbispora rosea subsp. aerata]|nr:hypothetical protein GCM10010116_33210 [Microbispora rosea subsp. aerata]GLJ83162.1 hypothetical protein GCM10017588_18890 [Microbispora rosea subsp. aerata]
MKLVAATAPPDIAAARQGAPRRAAPAKDISSMRVSSFMTSGCLRGRLNGIGEVPERPLTPPG